MNSALQFKLNPQGKENCHQEDKESLPHSLGVFGADC